MAYGSAIRSVLGCIALVGSLASPAAAQQSPADRFEAAVSLVERQALAAAREALQSLLADYDTPENRANVEFDSLLGGSHYYIGETYFQEDRFEEAAARYAEVIASFRTYRPESYYHLGLSKHYRRDYQGAIGTFAELAAQYPGSAQAPQALYYQGIGYELLKDTAAARSTFDALVARYPEHPWSKKAMQRASAAGGGQ